MKQFNDLLSRYQIPNTTIDILIPGIGMLLTAYHLGRQLSLQHYDLAINAGIAGTFKKNIPLGTIVNVTKDCVSELGAQDNHDFITIFNLGLMDSDTFPYQKGYLVNNPENLSWSNKEMCLGNSGIKMIEKLPRVKGITVNTIHGNIQSIEHIVEQFDPDIETMEGAAFLYGCLINRIPCIQIRSISNIVEKRDKSRWEIDLALKNLNRFLTKFVKTIASPLTPGQ